MAYTVSLLPLLARTTSASVKTLSGEYDANEFYGAIFSLVQHGEQSLTDYLLDAPSGDTKTLSFTMSELLEDAGDLVRKSIDPEVELTAAEVDADAALIGVGVSSVLGCL